MNVSLPTARTHAQPTAWPQEPASAPAPAPAPASGGGAGSSNPKATETGQPGANSLTELARQRTPFAAVQVAAAAPSAQSRQLSGAQWVSQFPTSRSLAALTPEFRASVQGFTQAIRDAGGSVSIAATHRPAERAYLMHYAWKVANGSIKASAVPAHPNVNIEWDHGSAKQSVAAAREMVSAYGMRHGAALHSNHTNRTAIDMNVSGVIGKTMTDANGDAVRIRNQADLHAVGASYGVHKLVSDPPHWSANGH